MDFSITGSRVFLSIAIVLIGVSTILVSEKNYGGGVFFGLLSLTMTILFCTTQIIWSMK